MKWQLYQQTAENSYFFRYLIYNKMISLLVLKHKECLLIRPMNLPSEKLAVLQIQNACFVGIPIIAAERARLISFPLRSLARPFVESCSLAVCVCVFVCCVASRVRCPGHFKPSVSECPRTQTTLFPTAWARSKKQFMAEEKWDQETIAQEIKW